MPNASKYIIDVANIRPGGSPIKGLYVGSSEKKYATLGNKCIYDKVLYELSVDNITNVEPNAQTVTISSYRSKRTHGNGAVDTLYINPSTKQVTANTSTASTKDTTVVVNQALTLNGATTGTGVTVTITQMKDYPIGLTLTISPKSTIPAAGGSISSSLTNYTYSVKANYKSGNNNVDVTSDSNTTITANVTGVTAASKGTTESNATTAGTIRFTAKYVCNGKTVATTTDVNITQDRNEVVSYANPTFTLTPSSNQTLPASGGSVTASVSNVQQVRTWSSTSTDTIIPTSTTEWTARTISCNSRGTVTGDTLTLGTTTATVTANGKPTTKSYVVYQQANAIAAYSKPTGLNLSCADIPAGGGTVTAVTGGTISQTRTYTSKATDTINPTVTITWNPSQTVTANSLGTTVKERTKITTLTATYTANSQSNTSSVDVYQAKNGVINTNYSPLNYEASISIGNGITAGGGSATVTASARHLAYDLYDSGSYNNQHYVADGVTVTEVSDNNNRYSYSNGTLTHSSMTTNLTTDSCTLRATNNTSTSTTKDASVSVTNTRWHEGDTPSNYVATISIGNGITAAGGSATVTASASHTNTYTWAYTSGSKQAGQTESISDTANVTEDSDPNNRFSYSNGTLTHGSMGTTATTDTCTLRVRNASSTATTNIASVSVQNKIESYNTTDTNYTASVSIGNGLTAAGGSATVTASGSHTHTSTPVYTSGVKGSTSTTYPSDGATWSITTNGNNRFTINGNTLNHSSMGTTATTDTVVVTATNNNSATATATDRKDISNGYTDSWNNPVVTFNPASLSFTSGASSQNITASATQSGTRTFDSTSTSSLSNSNFTWSWNKGSSDTWITIGAGGDATKSITVTANSGNARSGSVTATATGAGSKTGSKSASVEQARKESEEEGPFYGQLDISQVTLSCNDVPASGGIVYPSWEGTVKQYFYYTKDGVVTTTGWTNITPTVTWSPTSKTGSDLGTTVKDRTSLGDCTATFTGNSSKTATKAITVYQQANDVTSTEWGDLSLTAVTLSCGDVPARGGTVTPSWSGTAKQNRRYQYTSGSYTDWELANITPTVTWNPTSISGSDLGTTVIARTSIGDCTATFTGNSSRTATKSITVYQQANAVISTTWGDITVTVPSNQSVSSASSSFTLTSNNTEASQTRSDTYTSGSKSSETIGYTPDVSWEVSSNNTEFITGHTIVGGGPLPKISWGENTSTYSRSATITVSYTANGKTGSNSFTITQFGGSFECTIKNNSSTYGVYGNFGGPAGEKFSGDFGAGANRPRYMVSDTVILTDYFGVLQPSKRSGTVTFNCSGNGGSGTMSGNIQSNGTVNLTGTLTVKDGSTVTITIS